MNDQPTVEIMAMEQVSVVSMRDLTQTVLDGVTWSVGAGEFWVVGGLQRAGKSDLLMTAAGLLTPRSGACRLFGRETGELEDDELTIRLRVGLVFDGGQLFSHLTVAENVALPLRYHKNLSAAEAAQVVGALLEMLELSPLADVTPANMAVNWRQRAALARALILKPEILLLDNPLRGVGGRHAEWWLQFLEQLRGGHEWFGGRPMTVAVTTEDLRVWRGEQRKFAALKGKEFVRVGNWNEIESSGDPVIKELLAFPASTTV